MSVLLNQAKGNLSEGLVTTLLEHAGLRVARAGIEHLVDELRYAPGEARGALQLPKPLWAMPDLLVLDPSTMATMQLEVKFRRTFDEVTAKALHGSLQDQRQHWPDAWAVIVVATPPSGGRQYQDHIRMIGPDDLPILQTAMPPAQRWMQLRSLGSVFQMLHAVPGFHQDADRLLPLLRSLAEL